MKWSLVGLLVAIGLMTIAGCGGGGSDSGTGGASIYKGAYKGQWVDTISRPPGITMDGDITVNIDSSGNITGQLAMSCSGNGCYSNYYSATITGGTIDSTGNFNFGYIYHNFDGVTYKVTGSSSLGGNYLNVSSNSGPSTSLINVAQSVDVTNANGSYWSGSDALHLILKQTGNNVTGTCTSNGYQGTGGYPSQGLVQGSIQGRVLGLYIDCWSGRSSYTNFTVGDGVLSLSPPILGYNTLGLTLIN